MSKQMSREEAYELIYLGIEMGRLPSGPKVWSAYRAALNKHDGEPTDILRTALSILAPEPRTEPPGVVNDVLDELRKAVSKFPSWPSDPFHALAIIGEEFGELQQSFLKAHYENGNGADRQEAVQLAAMAIRFLMHWEDYEVKDTTQVKSALPMPKGGA